MLRFRKSPAVATLVIHSRPLSYSHSTAYFRDAQQLGSAADNRPLVAQAFVSTGTAYHSLRDYRNAGEFHRRAAAEEHQLGDAKLEAVALLFVCEDLFSQKQYDSALIQGTLSQIYYL